MSTCITYLSHLALTPSLLTLHPPSPAAVCFAATRVALSAWLHLCIAACNSLSHLAHSLLAQTHTDTTYVKVCVCACVYILHALFKRTALWAWTWASSPNCRLVCCLSARRSLFGLTGDSLPLAGFTCTQRKGDRETEGSGRGEEGASLHVRTCGVPFTT